MRAMKSGHLSGKKNSAGQPDWQKQFDSWRERLARCGEKASPERVHALRVATLRLKAEVDFRLQGEDSKQASEAAGRWNKQARKLRKVLGSVRDTDVHREILEKLRAGDNGKASCAPPECAEELERLEKRLHAERNVAAKRLLTEIEDRHEKLERASSELEIDCSREAPWAASDRTRMIRSIAAGLVSEVAGLSPQTLHDFRKQAKTARYLADLLAKGDPLVARQAALLKKMQNAAGEWHDLQTLAERAGASLSGGVQLPNILKVLAQDSYESAIDVCRKTTAELHAHGSAIAASSRKIGAVVSRDPQRGKSRAPAQ